MQKNNISKIHFIGIGGIGMSALAKVSLLRGYQVTGSDSCDSDIVNSLRSLGAKINIGHSEINIGDADLIVYSTAIKSSNVELSKARKLGKPTIHRSQMLNILSEELAVFSVAGSHGKTTTTSMLATILSSAGKKPSYIIGGVVHNLGSNANVGESNIFIAEADESDGSFVSLKSKYAVITNIDNDHIDFYGSIESLKKAFLKYISNISHDGFVVLNVDDAKTCELMNSITKKMITFSSQPGADYQYVIKDESPGKTIFELISNGQSLAFSVGANGAHNVCNAVSAIIVSLNFGLSYEEVEKALREFKGVKRRLDVIVEKENTIFIDDYAHHPTEISKVVNVSKTIYSAKRSIIVFQPHRYSRTYNFFSEFVDQLGEFDEVMILPTYSAGESLIEGFDSVDLVEKLPNAKYIEKVSDAIDLIDVAKNSAVFFLGAGDISKIARGLLSDK